MHLRTTATATRSTSRGYRSPASISRGELLATSSMARQRLSPTTTKVSDFQLSQRRRRASGRQYLVHRSALWQSVLRGHEPDASGRPGQCGGTHQSEDRSALCGILWPLSGSCRPTVIGGIQAEGSISWSRKIRFLTRTEFSSRPTIKSSMSSALARGLGIRVPAAKVTFPSLMLARTTSSQIQKLFTDCVVDGVKCGPDGMRCDVDGNLWCTEQCWPRGGLQWRDGVESCRQAHRPYPHPRGRREHLLRGSEAQPVVHGRKPVALCALHVNSRARRRAKT